MSDEGLLLAFRAGGERFAVPLDRVREAARPRRIAPLPGAPPEWSGVALVRGEALGVIDVAVAMGLPHAPAKPAPSSSSSIRAPPRWPAAPICTCRCAPAPICPSPSR